MGIKRFKAYTPSRRNMTVSDYAEITKKTPEKSLLAKKKKNAGRNSYGRITVRHQGGGNRQKYRIIDFKRNKDDMEATVVGIEYDPNRSANIALIKYEDGTLNYIIAPQGLKDGDKVVSGEKADIKPGNCLPISNIPVGTLIHNIELNPGQGAKLVRVAGQSAQLMAKEGKYAHVRLPSGEMRLVLARCRATIGVVGNAEHENVKLGKLHNAKMVINEKALARWMHSNKENCKDCSIYPSCGAASCPFGENDKCKCKDCDQLRSIFNNIVMMNYYNKKEHEKICMI